MKILKRGVPFSRLDGEELTFTRGEGPYVFDQLGRRYADFVLGFGPVILGHGRQDFNRSTAELVDGDLLFPGFSTLHTDFIEQLFGRSADDCAVSFFKTSSEAVTAALRLAAAATGRKAVIRCGFLGWHDAQSAFSPVWNLMPELRAPRPHPDDSFFRGVSGKERVLDWVDLKLESLVALLDKNADVVGAFAIDAYQITFSDGATIRAAMEMCRQRGIKVLFDETKTAGRVGEQGLWSQYRDVCDYVIAGKAIANGTPLSLLIIPEADAELYDSCGIGGTYAKDRMGVASALATMQIMRQCNGYTQLAVVGQSIAETIGQAIAAERAEHLLFVRRCFDGAVFDLALTAQGAQQQGAGKLLGQALAENGILALISHPSFTCLDHEKLNFEELLGNFRKAIHHWSDANF